MAGHSYVNALFDQVKHIQAVSDKVKKAYVYKDNAFSQVWSGASVVKYYDNSLLLETKEIDEGNDVLSAYTPSKTNNDFVGWALTKGGSKLNTLKATGEPITLYAIYKPYSMVTYVYPTGTSTPVKVYAGSDVLHPSGIPTVSNQTHVGWTYNGSRVTSLNATGSNMTVNAVYVPNTLTVASGTFNGWQISRPSMQIKYSLNTWNTAYVSGSSSIVASSPGMPETQTVYFNLSLGDYQSATGKFDQGTTNDGQGEGGVDGAKVYNYYTYPLSAGSHSLYAYIFPDTGLWEASFACILNITLSNPKKWT